MLADHRLQKTDAGNTREPSKEDKVVEDKQ